MERALRRILSAVTAAATLLISELEIADAGIFLRLRFNQLELPLTLVRQGCWPSIGGFKTMPCRTEFALPFAPDLCTKKPCGINSFLARNP
jgi:hypothetical protein